jgi:hypothetical protein
MKVFLFSSLTSRAFVIFCLKDLIAEAFLSYSYLSVTTFATFSANLSLFFAISVKVP